MQSKFNGALLLFVLLIISIAMMLLLYNYFLSNSNTQSLGSQGDTDNTLVTQAGTQEKHTETMIVLNLQSAATPESPVGSFFFPTYAQSYDELVKIPLNDASYLNPVQNPANEEQFALVVFPEGSAIPQIIVTEFDDLGQFVNRQQITDNQTTEKIDLHWSYNGEELFYATADLSSDYIANPDLMTIRKIDLKTGEDTEITNGSNPQVSRDGDSLLFVRDDGIYILNLVNGDEKRVNTPVGGTYSTFNRVVLSNDRSRAIFTDHINGYFVPFTVDWSKQELKFGVRVPESPATLAFSPDDTTIVYHSTVFVKDSEGKMTNPPTMQENALATFDLQSNRKRILLDLGDYNPERVRVSDWVRIVK